MDLREALADPRARLGAGVVGLLATAGAVHRDRVGAAEARAFRAVNGLPDALYPPAWVVMQLGAFGAVPAAAAAAWRAGDGELAGRLLLSGTGAWALAKLVKQVVRRTRVPVRARGRRRRPGRRRPAPARPRGPRPHPDRHAPGGADPPLRGRPSPARHRGRSGAGTGR